MTIFETGSVRYVLVKLIRNGDAHPQPNFMGTGLALVAILKKEETLKSFLQKRLPLIKEQAAKRVEETMLEHKRRTMKKNPHPRQWMRIKLRAYGFSIYTEQRYQSLKT